jgi:sporulation protein YlmC with PRC-barrel domain
MTTAPLLRTLLAGSALGALVAVTPVPSAPARAADAASNMMQPGQGRASELIGDPVYSAADQQLGHVVDLILDPTGQVAGVVIGVPVPAGGPEKNVSVPMGEFHTAPNQHLMVNRTGDQLQQAGAYQLDGGSGSAAQARQADQSRASQMIGQNVDNASGQEIGQVVDLVLDPTGQVAGVIIHVAAPVGVGDKNVAVPMKDIHAGKGQQAHMTVDRSKDQLQQASNYRLGDTGTASGSSTPPGGSPAGGGSGAAGGGGGTPSGGGTSRGGTSGGSTGTGGGGTPSGK